MTTRSFFDRELENLHLDLLHMAGLVQDAIDQSVVALKTQDKKLAQKVFEHDDDIDQAEKTVEARALRLLLQQQPVAKDLRSISATLKMITDLERIGDQAADIAEISLYISDTPLIKELVHIPQMAAIAVEMVKQSINAFVHADLELAHQVIVRDDEVDDLFTTVKAELIDLLHQKKENADQALDLLMIAKYLERIGDHATNIAEWAHFFITGEHI